MKFLLPAVTVITLAATSFAQTTATWTRLTAGDASGTWQAATNWLTNGIGGGTSNTADFSTLEITTNSTVTLDATVTIGNLVFGDTQTNTAASWILGNGGNTNNTLTLAGSNPAVTVNTLGTSRSVTLDTRVLGTNGFVKAGLGRLVLSNSANSYTGSISNDFTSVTNFGLPVFSTLVERGRLVLGFGTAAGAGNILVRSNSSVGGTALLDLNGNTVTNNIGLSGDNYLYNGNTNTAATFNGELWVNGFGRIGSAGGDGAGAVIVNGKVIFAGPDNQLVTGLGGSLTVLSGTVGHAGSNGLISVLNGTLRANDGVNIATNSTLRLGSSTNNGGIFESGANITRSIGDGAGLISLGFTNSTNTNIGFSAFGAPITVALGGTSAPTALTWGVTNFLQVSSTLVLNAATANNTLTFVNSLNFGGSNRTIAVNAATAIVNGGLSNGALTKSGAGTLVLAGTNSLSSPTTISAGTLRTTLASFSGDLTNNGVFYLDQPTNATFANTITGAGGFVKDGAGTLTLSATNGYTGNSTVSAGVLRIANSNSLGATTNTVTVASGATLDLNGVTNAGRFVTIGGNGVGGAGAVVNNGTNQAAGLRVVLTADSSLGGTTRMDLSGGGTLVNGGTNTLTKTGTNVLAINPGTVNVGQINVNQGTITSVNNAGSLGDTNFGTLVASNATLIFFNNNVAIGSTNSENITLAGGSTLASTTSTNPITLNGNVTLSSGTVTILVSTNGAGMVLGGSVTGAGGMNKADNGTLVLRGTNTYSGNTAINAGGLTLFQNARLTFTIGGNGTNNRVTGTNTFNADGVFVFNLAGASTTAGDSWSIVDTNLVATYGTNFLVNGFNGSGGSWTNTTNGATYVFTQSTGVLTVQSGATNAYNAWVAYWQGVNTNFTSTAGTDNPDGDPYNNNMEFAFDGNPTIGSPAFLTAVMSGTNAVFRYVARNTGVTYNVYSTTNLATGPWSTNPPVTVTNATDQSGISLTNNYTRKEFTVPATNRSFFRVEAVFVP